MPKNRLPIDDILSEVILQLQAHRNLVIVASPGSGKTTRIPPALLESFCKSASQKILVLVPRRVAAKYAALRVSEDLEEPCGETVGYQFRFEKRLGPKTRLIYLTEGLLMRLALANPQLDDVGCVILDEFHERHLHTDMAFAFLKHLQSTSRPDLKIVIMSATLDAERVASRLPDCIHITQTTPPHPLTIVYSPSREREMLEASVVRHVQSTLSGDSAKSGHILVFLPGLAAIRRCESELMNANPRNALILALHGDLDRDEQDLVFAPSDKTKIILSTNIAESSVTIPGVRTVIDSGLRRQMRFNAWSGLPALVTVPISGASAAQRAGRAARTGPGRCVRLYTEHDLLCRPAFDAPEIQTGDLAPLLLEFSACGIPAFQDNIWFEPPSPVRLQEASESLDLLGAWQNGQLTALGQKLARLPLAPRLARLLIAASENGVLSDALPLAARLSEGFGDNVNLLENTSRAHPPETAKLAMRQWAALLPDQSDAPKLNQAEKNNRLAKAFFAAFPDRVAKARRRHVKQGSLLVDEYVLATGGEALVESGKLATDADYVVIVDAQSHSDRKTQKPVPWIRAAVPIDEEELLAGPARLVCETNGLEWDSARSALLATQELRYGYLVLASKKSPPEPDEQAFTEFARHVFKWDASKMSNLRLADIEHALQHVQDPALFLSAWARFEIWRTHSSEAAADGTPQTAGDALKAALAGLYRLDDLRACDLGERFLATLRADVASAIHSGLPDRLKLPSGRFARIHYVSGQTPWVESRLQDFFGLTKTPALLNGKVALTAHLLAPNGRALQVTSDLAGFWKNTYPELRQQLMRRYPRHSWPEKP